MRLVSLAPSNTEILFALGLGKDIAAVTRYCDYPADAKYKPKLGGWLDVKVEELQKLKPDLILTSNFLQSELVERLSKKGLSVVHVDPRTMGDVYESIITIGESVGRAERAHGLVDEMKRRLGRLKAKTRMRRRLRVYCEEWFRPPTVSGNWVPELIESAGGTGFCPKGQKSFEVDADEIAGFNPAAVIVSWCGFGRHPSISGVRSRPVWNNIPAFRQGSVFTIHDSYLNRPGPRLVEGAEKISEILDRIRQKQAREMEGNAGR